MPDQWNYEVLRDSLPKLGDELPPYVQMSEKDKAEAAAEAQTKRLYLNPKTDTEKRVKYMLGSLFGAKLHKDGDWQVTARGEQFWARKVTDYTGTVKENDIARALYVEVKGVSPGRPFALSRLTKPNKKGEKSQHEKLQEVYDDGCLVWLAIGWWNAERSARPVSVEHGNRTIQRWFKDDVVLTITLFNWYDWTNRILPHLDEMGLKSITRIAFRKLDLLNNSIVLTGNRWTQTGAFKYDGTA